MTQPESLTFTGGDNRADQCTYYANGDVETDLNNTYKYDAEGRVCAVDNTLTGVTLYLYNAKGERVAKGSGSFSCNLASNGFTLTHRYVLDLAGRQMTEFDGSGKWVHTNVFANGQLLTTYSATGNSQTFALNDWQGTKRVQATANGEFSMSYASLPYGDNEVTSGSGPNATAQFFTGKQRDFESGNDYFGARYYNSEFGRWLSPDWSAKVEPVPYAKIGDPQSLALYTYLLDNVLTTVDPDGHRCGKASGSGCPNSDVLAKLRKLGRKKHLRKKQPLSLAHLAPSNPANRSSTKNCGAILQKGAVQTGLDALTIIPGEGDIAAAFYGGKEAFQVVQLVAGVGSTAISIGSSDRTGAGIGVTGIGVYVLDKNPELVKGAAEAIPIVGQFVGGAATLWDIGSTLHDYAGCRGW